MSYWKRLFSAGAAPPPVADPSFSRSSPPEAAVPPANRRSVFLEQVGEILDRDATEIDLQASLEADYGCADLDILECVEVAEAIWGVQLCPNPMTPEDIDYLVRRLPTLAAIVADAERRASSLR